MFTRGRYTRQPYTRGAGKVAKQELKVADQLAVALDESVQREIVAPEIIKSSDTLKVVIDDTTRRYSTIQRERGRSWNVKDIRVAVDYSNVKTALVGVALGEEYDEETGEAKAMTFEDVEWVKGEPFEVHEDLTIEAPVDKPLGQNWVGDPEAKELYGIYDTSKQEMLHRYGKHDSEANTPETLLWYTWLVLQRNNKPKVNVETTVADLERVRVFDVITGESLELDHEKIRLGNICRVLVRHEGVDIAKEARIIGITRHLKDPDKTIVELGDYDERRASDRFRNLSSRVERNERETTRVVASSKDYADQILQQMADGVYPYEGTFIEETKIYTPELHSPLVIGLEGFFKELIAGSSDNYMHLLDDEGSPYLNFYDDDTLRMELTSDRMQLYTTAGDYGGALLGQEDPTHGLPAITMLSPFMSRLLSFDSNYGLDRSTGIATRVHSGDLSLKPELQLYALDEENEDVLSFINVSQDIELISAMGMVKVQSNAIELDGVVGIGYVNPNHPDRKYVLRVDGEDGIGVINFKTEE